MQLEQREKKRSDSGRKEAIMSLRKPRKYLSMLGTALQSLLTEYQTQRINLAGEGDHQ